MVLQKVPPHSTKVCFETPRVAASLCEISLCTCIFFIGYRCTERSEKNNQFLEEVNKRLTLQQIRCCLLKFKLIQVAFFLLSFFFFFDVRVLCSDLKVKPHFCRMHSNSRTTKLIMLFGEIKFP